MPDLDGFELAAMIREHPRFQTTAIIFVSAVMMAHPDQLRGYRVGRGRLRARAGGAGAAARQGQGVRGSVPQDPAARAIQRGARAARAERTAELQRFNEELEQRIEQRTRERETALAQLFEAQKMDTIGQLTGGVAHDFNNLLMAVLGSLALLEKRLPDDPQCRRLVAERRAGRTARRGAHAAPAGILPPPGTQARGRGSRRAGQRDGGAL